MYAWHILPHAENIYQTVLPFAVCRGKKVKTHSELRSTDVTPAGLPGQHTFLCPGVYPPRKNII